MRHNIGHSIVAVLCASFIVVYKHQLLFDSCLDFRKHQLPSFLLCHLFLAEKA